MRTSHFLDSVDHLEMEESRGAGGERKAGSTVSGNPPPPVRTARMAAAGWSSHGLTNDLTTEMTSGFARVCPGSRPAPVASIRVTRSRVHADSRPSDPPRRSRCESDLSTQDDTCAYGSSRPSDTRPTRVPPDLEAWFDSPP